MELVTDPDACMMYIVSPLAGLGLPPTVCLLYVEGREDIQSTVKKTECWCAGGGDLTGADVNGLHMFQRSCFHHRHFQQTTAVHRSFCYWNTDH